MAFRFAVDANNIVVAIGSDEGQKGDYNKGQGTWLDVVLEQIPVVEEQANAETLKFPYERQAGLMFDGNTIVSRTKSDIVAEKISQGAR